MKPQTSWALVALHVFTNGFIVSFADHLQNMEGNAVDHQSSFQDPRAILGSAGIGPSFRTKRDKSGANTHALKAEEDALSAAADSVSAAEKSVAAGLEVEETRKALATGDNEEGDTSNSNDSEEDETENFDAENTDTEEDTGDEENEILDSKSGSHGTKDANSSSLLNFHKDSQLEKLMTESSDLATEVRVVFDILSKRESQLVDEMERLKTALTEAVSILRKPNDIDMINMVTANKRRRREFTTVQESPYKACVSIEPAEGSQSLNGGQSGSFGASGPEYPPEPTVREFIPDEPVRKTYIPQSLPHLPKGGRGSVSTNSGGSLSANTDSGRFGEDGVDLSKVYWLKLPYTVDDQTVHEKVRTVFAEVGGDGKDVLIIPVSRGLSSGQVQQRFLNAVRAKCSALTALRSNKFRTVRNINIKQV